jgi:hypothetical protein
MALGRVGSALKYISDSVRNHSKLRAVIYAQYYYKVTGVSPLIPILQEKVPVQFSIICSYFWKGVRRP